MQRIATSAVVIHPEATIGSQFSLILRLLPESTRDPAPKTTITIHDALSRKDYTIESKNKPNLIMTLYIHHVWMQKNHRFCIATCMLDNWVGGYAWRGAYMHEQVKANHMGCQPASGSNTCTGMPVTLHLKRIY